MVAPIIPYKTDPNTDATNQRWGAPDSNYMGSLLDGSNASGHRIQSSSIENLLPKPLYYSIYKAGTITKARNNLTGVVDSSSSTDAAIPIQAAISNIIASSSANNEQWGPVSSDKYVGGAIHIHRGVYDVNSQMWVRPDLGKEITVEIIGEGRTNTFLRTGTATNLGTADGNAILRIGDNSRAAINAPGVRDLTIINRGICHSILEVDFGTWTNLSRVSLWHSTGTATTNHGLRITGAGGKPGSHILLDHMTIEDVNGAGNRFSAYLIDLPNEFVVFNHCLALGFQVGFELVHSGSSVHWYSHAMNPSGTGFYIDTFGSAQFYHPHIEGGGVTDKAFDIRLKDPGSRCTIIDPDITHMTASTGVAYAYEIKNAKQQINIYNHKGHTSGVIPLAFAGTTNAGANAGDSYINLYNNDFRDVGAVGTHATNIIIAGTGNRGFRTNNYGTATIASGSTSIAVSHGLMYTPTLTNIQVTPTNSMGNSTKFWITNPTSTQFTINVNTDPGATTATFVWKAGRTL